MKSDNRIIQNNLHYLHFQMKDRYESGNIPTTDELLRIDLTKDVNQFREWAVKSGFYVPSLFTGSQSCGKSLSNLKFQFETALLQWKYKKFIGLGEKKEDFDFYKYIVSDEVEFNELIMKGLTNCSVALDELNDMNSGGDNTTVVRQIYVTNSEVNAQRYVYRGCATPRANSFYELTSLLVFRFVGRNDAEKKSYWMVYYNSPEDTQKYPLGVYESYVGDIMDMKWYGKYREKKFQRMDLMDKHAVRDKRELRNSWIILEVYNELSTLTKMGSKVPAELIKSTIEVILQKNRLIYTMLAKENFAEPLRGLLNLEASINANKMKKLKLDLNKPDNEIKYQIYTEIIDKEQEKLDYLINYRKKMIKILEEYEDIR